jgi:hypothetical protein
VTADQHPVTGTAGSRASSSGMGVGGFVTGLLSLLLGWLIPVVGVVLGALGLVIAVVVWIAAIALVTSS